MIGKTEEEREDTHTHIHAAAYEKKGNREKMKHVQPEKRVNAADMHVYMEW